MNHNEWFKKNYKNIKEMQTLFICENMFVSYEQSPHLEQDRQVTKREG